MNLDFRLIKFTNYGDDFVKGKLYLNSLEYYRGIESVINKTAGERNTAINDYQNIFPLTEMAISFTPTGRKTN